MSPKNRSAHHHSGLSRNLKSFEDQLKRISQSCEDHSLTIPLSLLVIASYLNRLRFIEIINERLRWDPDQWKYSPGVLAQLLVLATFIPSRKKIALSRIHEAFAGIDLQYLVGEPIDPESLNDDLFAQLLERMHEYGPTTLYRSISLTVRTVFNLPENRILHSDTTSHVLMGDYSRASNQNHPSIVHPAYGVSKEKRFDLLQIMSGAVADGDGLMLFCHILDGNTADCEYNNLMLSTLNSVYGSEFEKYTYIADCKVLTEKNIEQIYHCTNPVRLISCVPDNFAGKLSEKCRDQAYLDNKWEHIGICSNHPSGRGTEPEYWYQTYHKLVFGHPMWVHVYRKVEAEKRLERFLNEQKVKYCTDLKNLTTKEFICEPDARKELEAFTKTHTRSIYSTHLSIEKIVIEKNQVGRPSKTPKPLIQKTTWRIMCGDITKNMEKIERKRRKIDSFCLITSIPPKEMNSKEVILAYKGQNVVESMFSLLKEPLLASTLFLEKPERIEALMTILYFSVLMHGILQLMVRLRVACCPEPPKIGNENRPLIRPKSSTVLSILENFEFKTLNGVLTHIRSKQQNRRDQLDLIFTLVDFDPARI